ncbi:MAG TPA: helix-turn-helix transcriptional regulator, partial [Gaiellaceae bacterium]|nr:helix-turn-helix transcriptional regulator [Gaiellaceae bacterium]
ADHVESLLAVGRADDARELLAEWEAQARTLGHRWAIPEIVRCRGLVAIRDGDVAPGVASLEEAVELHEEVGDRFGRARALLLLGAARRRARQKRSAREAIEAALAGFEAIGAAAWAERARAALGSIGGRTRADGLTPAEPRVAALVAEGRTNREVAAALFLGERTVETHLTHVYAKLGIRSRTELARTLR